MSSYHGKYVPEVHVHDSRGSSSSRHNPRGSSGSFTHYDLPRERDPRHSSGSLKLYESSRDPRSSSGSLRQYEQQPPESDPYADSSLPLNTPWSPPGSTSSSGPSRRPRGSSTSEHSHHHHSTHSPSRAPVIIQSQPHEHRSHGESGSSRSTLVVPASSGHRRSRSDTTNYSTHIGRYYDSHQRAQAEAAEAAAAASAPRSGRTRFPKRLVSREAAEEKGYAFSLEDGAVTVLQALTPAEIDALVTLTEEIRRRSNPQRKAVAFFEKTIVHEVPTPTSSSHHESSERHYHHSNSSSQSTAAMSQRVLLIPGAPPGTRTSTYTPLSTYLHTVPQPPTYLNNSRPKIEPLNPPGPSTPKTEIDSIDFTIPRTSSVHLSPEEKLLRAAEKVEKAERIAEKKERRAKETGRSVDADDAWRAREKADSLRRKLRREEEDLDTRSVGRSGSVRSVRSRKGDVVVR